MSISDMDKLPAQQVPVYLIEDIIDDVKRLAYQIHLNGEIRKGDQKFTGDLIKQINTYGKIIVLLVGTNLLLVFAVINFLFSK
jgi:hypothetical protein